MSADDHELDAQPITAPPGRETSSSHSSALTEVESDQIVEVPDINFNTLQQQIDIAASQEGTRAKIAWVFTVVFLSVVGTALVLPTLANILAPNTFANPLEITRELLTISASILAGPFGFIVGFYFKQNED